MAGSDVMLYIISICRIAMSLRFPFGTQVFSHVLYHICFFALNHMVIRQTGTTHKPIKWL